MGHYTQSGTRMTALILMRITFTGYGTTTASDWWPTDARDGGHVDVIEGDMYEFPHATNTDEYRPDTPTVSSG